MLPLAFEEIKIDGFVNRLNRYRLSAISDSQSAASWQYFPGTGGNISYSLTALWLATLERHLGWETLQPAMSLYYERYKFKHPRPEDFFGVIQEVAGQDLTWFFDQTGQWALAIIFLTVLVKLILLPLTNKSFTNMQKMQKLAPESCYLVWVFHLNNTKA